MKDINKTLPHDLETERIVLAHIMAQGILDITLDPSDFYLEAHRKIFLAIKKLHDEHKKTETMLVIAALRDSEEIEAAGGPAYVIGLGDGMPMYNKGLPAEYPSRLYEKRALRKLIEASNEAMVRAYQDEPYERVAGSLQEVIDRTLDCLQPTQGPKPISKLVSDTFEEIQQICDSQKSSSDGSVRLGLTELDRMIPAGLKGDELMIVGGRPGQGKTSLLLTFLVSIAREGKNICFFSIEMGALRVVMKILSLVSGIPLIKITTGFLSREDFAAIAAAAAEISQWNVWIDDSTGIQVSDMHSRIRRLRVAMDALLVDYVQIISPPQSLMRAPDHEKIGSISRDLKFLNKRLGVPIIAAAQLSRKPSDRKGGRPQLSDLRQSGQIEQDADVVLLLHRPEDGEESILGTGVGEAIIAKQRSGPVGTVNLSWNGQTGEFGNLWTGVSPEY